MKTSRRTFLKGSLAGAAAAGLSGYPAVVESQQKTGSSESLLKRDSGLPSAATFDRLSLDWYKKQVGKLKQKMREVKVDAIVLRDPLNIVYFTGYFYINTERPYSVLIPVEEDAIYWFYPGLDRDLVDSWWKTDGDYYFDYLHAEAGYPNKGEVNEGPTVDLFEMELGTYKKRGFY